MNDALMKLWQSETSGVGRMIARRLIATCVDAAEAADAVVMMASDAPPDAAKAMLEELATNMEKTNE